MSVPQELFDQREELLREALQYWFQGDVGAKHEAAGSINRKLRALDEEWDQGLGTRGLGTNTQSPSPLAPSPLVPSPSVPPSPYVVPVGMLKATGRALVPHLGFNRPSLTSLQEHLIILQAAIEWLAENPMVPGPMDMEQIIGLLTPEGMQIAINAAIEWQRRMFLAPPPDPDPLIGCIMRHFDDVINDKQDLRNRTKSALKDYESLRSRK